MRLMALARKVAPFIILCVAYLGFASFFDAREPGRDPDRYYHFAVSRMTAEHGLLHSLPQVSDLKWDQFFPEKEFLFHQLTWLAYRWKGDRGVVEACHLLGILVLISLLWAGQARTQGLGAATLIVLLMVFDPTVGPRLIAVRPHLLGVLFFIMILGALLSESIPWLLASAVGFGLSYHAFYMPLGLLIAWWAWKKAAPSESFRATKIAAAGIAGLAAGYLVNPYFPSPLVLGYQHLLFALDSAPLPGVSVGSELLPMQFGRWLGTYWPLILVIFLIPLAWLERRKPSKEFLCSPAAFAAAIALGSLLLSRNSPRLLEYSLPCAVIALILFFQKSNPSWCRRTIVGVLVALAVVRGFALYEKPRSNHYQILTNVIMEAIDSVPASAGSAKVYNCSWLLGEFLIYRRPDLKFVDLLDPRLLQHVSPEKFEMKRRLLLRDLDYPYRVVKEGFGADYFFCGDADVNDWIEKDARFMRIYPRVAGSRVRMYRLAPN